MKRFFFRLSALAFLFLAGTPAQLIACPVCFGDKESAEVEGARWAILFLLGVTGTVLSAVVAFMLHLRRRSRLTLGGTVEMPSSN